jgi:hypothetical protein
MQQQKKNNTETEGPNHRQTFFRNIVMITQKKVVHKVHTNYIRSKQQTVRKKHLHALRVTFKR